MNFIKATFGDSSLSSLAVLSSEFLKMNILVGSNGVNLSERCSFFIVNKFF